MEIIFDLGNVVLDWNIDKILMSLDISQEERDLLHTELFKHQDWLDMDQGIQSEQLVASRVVARSNLKRDVIEQALLAAKTSLTPIPQSIQLMQDLYNAGIKMYCLSNMSSETYEYIKTQKFFDLFDGIVISGKEKCMKPDAKIFNLTIERYDLSPSETLFIDDSLPNISTACDLGILGFHFKRRNACYSKIRGLLF
ncbi:HAD family phosphatase [Acaryochloris sp. IP29b_bin.148]|uniref:HAD family hydrolase n=1 Tax=Acaryochloris sp. IP29b_bin.148 TaxID=2969218 RepID=UPI00261AFC28|nr:HAD family phosphatase [Acaryochloris sp. IP29b_bin.148]